VTTQDVTTRFHSTTRQRANGHGALVDMLGIVGAAPMSRPSRAGRSRLRSENHHPTACFAKVEHRGPNKSCSHRPQSQAETGRSPTFLWRQKGQTVCFTARPLPTGGAGGPGSAGSKADEVVAEDGASHRILSGRQFRLTYANLSQVSFFCHPSV